MRRGLASSRRDSTVRVRAEASSSVSVAVFVPAGRIDRPPISRIEQARLFRETQARQHVGLGEIGIDQQYLGIALHRHREREIDRAEGLAVARSRRTDEHGPRLVALMALRDAFARDQQLALDQAEFLGERPHRRAGHDHPGFGQHAAIDAGDVAQLGRFVKGRRQLLPHRRAQFGRDGKEGRIVDRRRRLPCRLFGDRCRLDVGRGHGCRDGVVLHRITGILHRRPEPRAEIIGARGPFEQRVAADGLVHHIVPVTPPDRVAALRRRAAAHRPPPAPRHRPQRFSGASPAAPLARASRLRRSRRSPACRSPSPAAVRWQRSRAADPSRTPRRCPRPAPR
ncbi:hypothetical protein WR25_25554 [Diploscapter pachys]|uniref:Uncharacterized protein n=1 Tax=Diploscapter pachys TaxID=2018661 RepID=A0A2A2K2L8_9BILA|nr:hypothetical protein WR25_25554 [Diploscapter pachys]